MTGGGTSKSGKGKNKKSSKARNEKAVAANFKARGITKITKARSRKK